MNTVSSIEQFLVEQSAKDQLRFITCGSVDDGKSTLLGRLLYDSKTIFEDQFTSAEQESKKYGTQGDQIDFALLVDGLQAEREQGITIDLAWRFFETDKRRFIATDTPGHIQYTRNMATGASGCELAVILIDASQGVLDQTRRHACIVSLLGIEYIILAVNKMDLTGFEQQRYDRIVSEFTEFAQKLNVSKIYPIPLCALDGDNVFFSGADNMPWYQGSTFVQTLEQVKPTSAQINNPFRFPVQWVNRLDSQFRGFSGTVASGEVRKGMKVISCLSGQKSKIASILTPAGEAENAQQGQAITLMLEDAIDISRGDMLATEDRMPELADHFAAHIIWMDTDPMLQGRGYLIRFATHQTTAQITDLVHKVDINSLDQLAAKTLALNDIGYCKLALTQPAAFDPYEQNKTTGSFVLIDQLTNATVGAGVIKFALRRASNISWQTTKVNKSMRTRVNGHRSCVLWFTGLSGAGKSTIADAVESRLYQLGKKTYLLDGDNLRHGLTKDLGFTENDRIENIRRAAEVAKLMADAGMIVMVSLISPYRAERDMARQLVDTGEFIEIFVDTPLEICESRDPKGLYKKARSGQLPNFTGIDAEYQKPEQPEIHLDSGYLQVSELTKQIIDYLEVHKIL